MKKYTISVSLVFILLLFITNYSNAQISSGLVGYWTLDEGSGIVANDSSSSGNNGTISGSSSWSTGKIGNSAFSFNGTTNYIDAGSGSASLLNFGMGSYTVSSWINLSNSNAEKTIIAKIEANESLGWSLRIQGSSANIWVRSGTTSYTSSNNATIPLNTWSHIVAVVDRNQNRIFTYLNGTLIGSGVSISGFGSFDTGTDLFIGDERASAINRFSGSLDDIRIYSRALSASEITDLYNYTGGSIVSPPNPPATTTPTTCTSFTYSAWSSCTNSSQTRTVTSSLPFSCTGGTPITTQSCSVTPPVIPPTGSRIFYIDYSTGSDANSGTTKSSPWKHAPGMIGASMVYSHQAGDNFIFKGGVMWDRSNFQWNIVAGGSAGNIDYYGVDKTWYIGSSWTRPVFDMQNQFVGTGNAVIFIGYMSYVTIDNIEIRNQLVPSGVYCTSAVSMTIAGNIILQNMYIHGWSIQNLQPGGDGAMTGGICSNNRVGGPITVTNSTFDDLPYGNMGGAIYGSVSHVTNNIIHDVPNAIVIGAGTITGNIIYNITNDADPLQHENAIETITNDVRTIMANNIVHNVAEGVATLMCPNIDAYNNIIYASGPIALQIDPTCGNDSSFTANVYNNTLQGSGSLFRVVNRGGTLGGLVLRNNLYISDYSSPVCYNSPAASCSNVNSVIDDHNVLISNSTATTQGYLLANNFKTISDGLATIDKGISVICPTCTSLIYSDITGISRPQGSSWDIGAYEYTGVVTPPTPIIGDFNNDRLVNSLDFSLLVSAWNQNNATYDINHDGIVNSLDYVVMVQNWTQ